MSVVRQEDGRRGNWSLPLMDELAGRELYQPINCHDVKKTKSDNQSNQDQTERLCNGEGSPGVLIKHSTESQQIKEPIRVQSVEGAESDLQPQS